MDDVRNSGRFDWLVELGGAAAPAAAGGFAALKLAPAWALAVSLGAFALGYLAMRSVRPEPRTHALAGFDIAPFDCPSRPDELLLDAIYLVEADELLLEEIHAEEADELLLEDALPCPPADSRVIRLFAVDSMPTAGELKDRIDRHLATAARPVVQQVPDASDALFAALADLRRSLR